MFCRGLNHLRRPLFFCLPTVLISAVTSQARGLLPPLKSRQRTNSIKFREAFLNFVKNCKNEQTYVMTNGKAFNVCTRTRGEEAGS
jgi:hypothetical protein